MSHVPHCLVWDVYEQVCVAALDCGDLETAEVRLVRTWELLFSIVLAPSHATRSSKTSFPGVSESRN